MNNAQGIIHTDVHFHSEVPFITFLRLVHFGITLAISLGLLSLALTPHAETWSVEDRKLFLPGDSTTFHGRDRFAPVAAALANGTPISRAGPAIGSIVRIDYQEPQYGDESVLGRIVAVDRFGNLITDIERAGVRFEPFELHARDLVVDRVEVNYGDAGPGPFLITGSSGRIEISVANGSAAERLRLRRLQRVEVRKRPV